MIQAMYSGVSGMKAFKTQLDVIGNNVANLNTIGFKGSRVTFQEMMNQTMRGATAPRGNMGGSNPMQLGLGVNIGMIDVNQLQGSLQATGKLTDAAIEGSGFFVLANGSGTVYSRDGTFNVDSDFNLVNSTGLPVLGWAANPITGDVDTNVNITAGSKIRIPIGQLSSARQTSAVTLGGNIDASQAVGYTTMISTPIYDSLGISHQVNLTFEKTGPSQWTYSIDSTETTPAQIGSGNITFDAFGKSNLDVVSASMTLTSPNGSTSPLAFDISFASVGQLNGIDTVGPTYQDGLPLGVLDSFTVSRDGTISGSFSNGNIQPLGRLAMAGFANPSGLNKIGGNILSEGPNSGIPQIGPPDTSNRGRISAGFLEMSNVDLSNEFANMIVAQRGFQANSRIITVSDEVLNELVQLKR